MHHALYLKHGSPDELESRKMLSYADKGLSSQSYGFSNSDVWMRELGHSES